MDRVNNLRKKRWLKKRLREKKIKKQNNYRNKTHKGTDSFSLTENIRRAEREKKEEELKMKKLNKIFNLKGDKKNNVNKKKDVWRTRTIRKAGKSTDKQWLDEEDRGIGSEDKKAKD